MTAKSDLSAMQTFVRIVEAGSLSSAAAQLGMSQPTVSRRLSALESSLGVRLLLRTTHSMQLTEEGERYFRRARSLLDDWEEFESELRGEDDAPEGLLRVAAPHAFGQDQLLRPALEYLRRYPRVSLEWRLHDGPLRFVEDAFDCAIRVGAVPEPSLVARKLGEVPRVVVAAPSVLGGRVPTRPSQLGELPWLALSVFYRTSVRLERDRGASATVRFQPRLVTDSLFALRNAALAGLGVAVVSRWVVADDLEAGALVHVLPRWRAAALPLYLAYPQARFYPARLRRFVEVFRTVLGAEAALLARPRGA